MITKCNTPVKLNTTLRVIRNIRACSRLSRTVWYQEPGGWRLAAEVADELTNHSFLLYSIDLLTCCRGEVTYALAKDRIFQFPPSREQWVASPIHSLGGATNSSLNLSDFSRNGGTFNRGSFSSLSRQRNFSTSSTSLNSVLSNYG